MKNTNTKRENYPEPRKVCCKEVKKRYLTPCEAKSSSLKVKSFAADKIALKPSSNDYLNIKNTVNAQKTLNYGKIEAYIARSSKSQISIGLNKDMSLPQGTNFENIINTSLIDAPIKNQAFKTEMINQTGKLLNKNTQTPKKIFELENDILSLKTENKTLKEKYIELSEKMTYQSISHRNSSENDIPQNETNFLQKKILKLENKISLLENELMSFKTISKTLNERCNEFSERTKLQTISLRSSIDYDIPQEPIINNPLSLVLNSSPQKHKKKVFKLQDISSDINPKKDIPQGYNTVDPSNNYSYNQDWEKYVSEATYAIQYWWSQCEDFKFKFTIENEKVQKLEEENIKLKNEYESLNATLKYFDKKQIRNTEEKKSSGKNIDFDKEIKELKEIIRINFGIIEKKDNAIKILEDKLILAKEKIDEVERKAELLALKTYQKVEKKINKECFGYDINKTDDYYKHLYLKYLQEITDEDKNKARMHKLI
ncbi:hypothetical protein SteCoe_28279 [Stentor coeruleus]|uniref:Uncharacterized protein n=1 Tax=Stentor coeruleus TaxID=5963 RepID=A0A1R2B8L8_9CILI|nr:hypothetical protein SteCoe_28279 [Stentor coeruleus]